jgi:hypothetical protein
VDEFRLFRRNGSSIYQRNMLGRRLGWARHVGGATGLTGCRAKGGRGCVGRVGMSGIVRAPVAVLIHARS